MKIRVVVGPNEITTRGREISRLLGRRNADFWRRAAAGTWRCVQVAGSRCETGMEYLVELTRFDQQQVFERIQRELALDDIDDAAEVAVARYPLASFECLAGFEIVEPEKRRRPAASDGSGE